ncbi:hypothetical protein L1049_027746 [Liquidambar formosana]|uniref:Homeobox protein knotted-1-like 1 n=1 Tax=Liquidambar formosana TaxID=63359 RepID=A0AAP0WVH1_LIQFO
MEANRNSSENTERHFGEGTLEEEDEEEMEILKRRISSHPLYGLLVDSHLDCLKVGLGNVVDIDTSHRIVQKQADSRSSLSMFNQEELDQFMEAYCTALNKLKEAMEEPHLETMAFINSMHSQLKDLGRIDPRPAEPATMFSGEGKKLM